MTPYKLPTHPLEALANINFEEAVGPDDPRFVDTDVARGGVGAPQRLAKKFSLDLANDVFFPTGKKHVLLFGPIGSGKSTELLRLARTLEKGRRLFPILLNVRGEIDINNLQYADVLMALASAVAKRFDKLALDVPAASLEALRKWFMEHAISEERIKELSAELQSEAGVEFTIPFLAKLMTRLTSAFKSSSVYKDSLREVVNKTFSQFALAFNEFVLAAEQALKDTHRAERLLLIVDGTDKIPLKDAERLFVFESEQLLAIEALVLYTAPISLKYGGTGVSKLDTDEVLPIIKLQHRDGTRHEPGWKAMREMLGKRIDLTVFSDAGCVDKLIEYSGGHPRELLRLLRLACELTETDRIDLATVERAIDKLAADYRYWLRQEDYALLAQIDANQGAHIGNDELTRNLLWRLALLQYNDGSWRASHPAVRRLEGYIQARQEFDKQAGISWLESHRPY